MSEQKSFEDGVSVLIKKAFTTTTTRCRKITNLDKPLRDIQDYILVENQLGQSLLVEGTDIPGAIIKFYLHCAEQIQDLETKLFYTKERFGDYDNTVADKVYFFLDPEKEDLVGGGSECRYLPIMVADISEPLGDDEPHGRKLRLPLKQNSLLADFPVNTTLNPFEPMFYLGDGWQVTPSVCLVVEPAPEGINLPNFVSVVGRSIVTIGDFPVLYGIDRYIYDEYCNDEGREQLLTWLKNFSGGEEYFVCKCGKDDDDGAKIINKLLQLEHFDYFVPAEDETLINVNDWSRIDRSFGIWLNGQLDGYIRRDEELRPISEDDPW